MNNWVHKVTATPQGITSSKFEEGEEDEVECGGLWARMHNGATYPNIEPVQDIDYEEVNEQKLLEDGSTYKAREIHKEKL